MITKLDLIEEIKRLAEESPSGSCTRDYFRRNSEFSEHAVLREFGTFGELRKAAGMDPGRITAAYGNRQAALATEERFQAYAAECIYPWAREYQPVDADKVTMVIGSDFHGEMTNPFALRVFLDTITRLQPDHVVLAGDIANFEAVGRWSKNPNRLHNLQTEIDFIVEKILRATRDAAPNAQIDLILGNHEMWLNRYLAEQAPGLASLRCLSFGELFCLTELDIGLVYGGDMLAPSTTDKNRQVKAAWQSYYDTFVVTHGTATGPNAAKAELARFKMSGCSGHLHTPSSAHSSSLDRPHLEWNVLPMMTGPAVGEIYLKGLPTTWQVGFAIVDIFPETRTHFYQPVHVRSGLCMSAGALYRDGGQS